MRPLSTPPRTARPSGIVAVLTVVAVLLGACATPVPTPGTTTPPASPGAAQSTLPPAADASPGITPLPTEPPATGWKRLDIAVPQPSARLVATRAGAASVHPATAFHLTSVGGEAISGLAARLRTEPRLDLQVDRVDGPTAVLRPAAPLRQGTVYRFELERPDGSVEAAWAVQAGWPLHVDTMLPGDGAQDVPTTTGIEITFDQPGVSTAALADHVKITPVTRGNWVVRGHTHVFIPRSPLKRSTLYTVTVRAGVRQTGTGMQLEERLVTRFETSGTKAPNVHITFGRALYDADPADRPALGLRMWSEDEEGDTKNVRRLAVKVHRLAGLQDALTAWRLVRGAPDWTWSGTTPVKTASLPLVIEARVPLVRDGHSEEAYFRLPRRLGAGWYVVAITHAGVSRQAILQVTPVATYAMATTSRTVAWVNNLASNTPVAGARVAVDGQLVGTTDGDGLVVARTPADIIESEARATRDEEEAETHVAVVRAPAGTMFVPLDDDSWCWSCGMSGASSWTLFTLDREQYRQTDTINAWGVVRDRTDGSVPDKVRLTLEVSDELAGQGAVPPVATATVTPDSTGSFLARIRYADLPPGNYRVHATAAGATIADYWVRIGPIAKPSWKLDLTVDRHAVIDGEQATVTASAAFYEGTPVAGASLRFSTGSWDEEGTSRPTTSATGADGVAGMTLAFRIGSEEGQYGPTTAYVRGEEPEEAEIAAEQPVMVFRSSALLDAELDLRGTRLVATGAVHAADLARYEQPGIDLYEVDPRGAPMAERRVTLAITEVTPVRHKVGTRYDFIAKRVITIWNVSQRRKQLGRFNVVTEADGTFRLVVPVKAGEHSYELVATHADDAGRRIHADAEAYDDHDWYAQGGQVVSTGTTNDEGAGEYGIGERVSVRFVNGTRNPETERYLFLVLARGLRSSAIQAGPSFSTRFGRSLLPDAHVGAVRFTGTGYEVAVPGFTAAFRATDRQLTVQLTADRARYEPGGKVTVGVRTLDGNGRPVAASVFLRAVDEKLFTIGAARQDTPLESLYEGTTPGMLGSGASHSAPGSGWGDGKDTTGGGSGDTGRSDFRDWLLASLVRTGADGRGSVSFDLSDDLTSWRVLASAVSADLEAGAGSVSVPVGLPLFVEVVLAPEYLAVDRPVLRLRAHGTSLSAGDPVTFEVSSPTLPLAPVSVPGLAFEAASLALPALSEGTHSIRVAVSAGTGAARRIDALVRTFRVVDTRTTLMHTASGTVEPGTTVGGADGTTVVTLADGGRGRVVPVLDGLAAADPFRADTAIAAAIARDVLASAFALPDDPALGEIDLLRFQDGSGVSVIPYASAGLELSAMAAFSGDEHLNRSQLAGYLGAYESERDGQLPPTSRLYLLLGQASIGQASIGDVMLAATDESLTPSQVVTVGLAALAVGDDALARTLYTRLLGRWGERQGPWVRVNAGNAETTAVTTARAAILAAALGDPLAVSLDAEVAVRPPRTTTVALEQAIAARYWAARQPAVNATVAVTVDGERREVTLAGGLPVRLELTPAQRATFRLDPVSGAVLWSARWDGPLAADDLRAPAGLSVTRTVTPAGTIPAVSTVIVTLDVTVPNIKGADCWRLVELVPSGLAPVDSAGRWEEAEDEGQGPGPGVVQPSQVTGQRVEFCTAYDPQRPVHHLRYLARVVTPGDYRWEEASIQAVIIPDAGLVLPAFDVSIANTGS